MIAAALAAPLTAQQIKIPQNLERLSADAEESVNVTLDGSLLQLASRFLSDKDPDDAKVKKILAGLQGIYVRSFEFAQDGAYTAADLNEARALVQGPTWSRIVGVKSKHDGENVDVYLKVETGGKIGGLVVISAEPRELTIVNIVGTIDPDQLVELGGQYDIPRL